MNFYPNPDYLTAYHIVCFLKLFLIPLIPRPETFSSPLYSKRLAKNPLFGAISLDGPRGPH
jgi:hypothetical protein